MAHMFINLEIGDFAFFDFQAEGSIFENLTHDSSGVLEELSTQRENK